MFSQVCLSVCLSAVGVPMWQWSIVPHCTGLPPPPTWNLRDTPWHHPHGHETQGTLQPPAGDIWRSSLKTCSLDLSVQRPPRMLSSCFCIHKIQWERRIITLLFSRNLSAVWIFDMWCNLFMRAPFSIGWNQAQSCKLLRVSWNKVSNKNLAKFSLLMYTRCSC